MRHPNDYRLERWLAALFSLLFLLPVIADAAPLVSPDPSCPASLGDVDRGYPTLEVPIDAQAKSAVEPNWVSIRAAEQRSQ